MTRKHRTARQGWHICPDPDKGHNSGTCVISAAHVSSKDGVPRGSALQRAYQDIGSCFAQYVNC